MPFLKASLQAEFLITSDQKPINKSKGWFEFSIVEKPWPSFWLKFEFFPLKLLLKFLFRLLVGCSGVCSSRPLLTELVRLPPRPLPPLPPLPLPPRPRIPGWVGAWT